MIIMIILIIIIIIVSEITNINFPEGIPAGPMQATLPVKLGGLGIRSAVEVEYFEQENNECQLIRQKFS